MKKNLLIAMIFLLAGSIAFSQVSGKDFQNAEVTWYGLDFTKAKMIGSVGFTEPEKIHNELFDSWNGLLFAESDKYDLKSAFKKPTLKYDLEMIKPLNKSVDYTKLVIDKSYSITKEDVQDVVKQYKTDQKDGYGIVFVVESFDKTTKMASVWVTIFRVADKQVIITERMNDEASGIGLRNYWDNAIYRIITNIRGKKYKSWFR